MKLIASFVAPLFLLQTKTNQTCYELSCVKPQWANVCNSNRHFEERFCNGYVTHRAFRPQCVFLKHAVQWFEPVAMIALYAWC